MAQLTTLDHFPYRRRHNMSGNPPDEKRYTSLVTNNQGRWLCPECFVRKEDTGQFWSTLHYFHFECFDLLGTQEASQTVQKVPAIFGRRKGLAITDVDLAVRGNTVSRENWPSHFYEDVLAAKTDVAYFANSPTAVQCCNRWKFENNQFKEGFRCDFKWDTYMGSMSFENLYKGSDEQMQMKILKGLSVGATDTSGGRVSIKQYWMCLKCLVRATDLEGENREDWKRHVFSSNQSYNSVLVPLLRPQNTTFYCFINNFLNGPDDGLVCANKRYGNGPLSADSPCGYAVGTPLEFGQDQFGCCVARLLNSSSSVQSDSHSTKGLSVLDDSEGEDSDSLAEAAGWETNYGPGPSGLSPGDEKITETSRSEGRAASGSTGEYDDGFDMGEFRLPPDTNPMTLFQGPLPTYDEQQAEVALRVRQEQEWYIAHYSGR